MTIEHITVFHDQLCITSSKPELNFYKFVCYYCKKNFFPSTSLVFIWVWSQLSGPIMLARYTTTSSPVLDLDMCTLHSCSHSMLYVATGIYTGTQSTTCRPYLAGSA